MCCDEIGCQQQRSEYRGIGSEKLIALVARHALATGRTVSTELGRAAIGVMQAAEDGRADDLAVAVGMVGGNLILQCVNSTLGAP